MFTLMSPNQCFTVTIIIKPRKADCCACKNYWMRKGESVRNNLLCGYKEMVRWKTQKEFLAHYAVIWPELRKSVPYPEGKRMKTIMKLMMALKKWVKFVLTKLDSWLVRWLNAAITIISLESDSLSLPLEEIESINMNLTCLLHIYVCAVQNCVCVCVTHVCVCCQCMPQLWL